MTMGGETAALLRGGIAVGGRTGAEPPGLLRATWLQIIFLPLPPLCAADIDVVEGGKNGLWMCVFPSSGAGSCSAREKRGEDEEGDR